MIAISETWLDNEKEVDVNLEGYELFTTNRVNKKGGGVALFVNCDLKCKKNREYVSTNRKYYGVCHSRNRHG